MEKINLDGPDILTKCLKNHMESFFTPRERDEIINNRLHLSYYDKWLSQYREFSRNCDSKICRRTKTETQLKRTLTESMAMGMAAYCFRNTCLEDFHSQNEPINDEKMKILMKECTDRCNDILSGLFSTNEDIRSKTMLLLIGHCQMYCSSWDIPDIEHPSYINNK